MSSPPSVDLPDHLMNPISGVVIPFPEPLRIDDMGFVAVSPPPDHVVFVVMSGAELYLCRQGDRNWTRMILPSKEQESVTEVITFGGKLCCICSRDDGWGDERKGDHLIIVDPLQMPPAVDLYRMADWNRTTPPGGMGSTFNEYFYCLVESDGEVLLVSKIYEFVDMVGYKLFRLDLTKRMWMRVESLGDRLFILHHTYAVSLLAADVGLKRNCIYFSTGLRFENLYDIEAPWKVFDLGAGTVTDVAFPNASLVEKTSQHIFVPSIC